ncbi:uncharacterized protein LOC118423833 [Branchiostoma floridae]|uniref:Uncharacterized protein LOC118423833 n=1 Tax=Branchiostoma floridae TaxID=7739 RepID=A0A9J7N0A6_BRAFL|nr:uncharacterized protein LOC118423833 [Branchiostoma floridae]
MSICLTSPCESVVPYRLHHLPSILPHIRFNLLTPDDTAAILEHPLVMTDSGSSEVIKNAVQKGNPNLKPRLGRTTEMVLLSAVGSNELLFMNPREGKYISCSYNHKDFPLARDTDVTVTSDNNIYRLIRERDNSKPLFVLKYNHAENVWEDTGMSSVSKSLRLGNNVNCYEEHLVEVDQTLYYLAENIEECLVSMRKYSWHTDQWQECSQLQFDNTSYDFNSTCQFSAALSCSSDLYFLTSKELHCYDPRQDRWYKQSSSPQPNLEMRAAVSMGTEIFCTDFSFTQTLVYDTESDYWQKLPGWPDPGIRETYGSPYFFVLENQLHILLNYSYGYDDDDGKHLVYVYDRSADAWRDLKATLPDKEYYSYGNLCHVARIYLPYLKVQDKET